MASMKIVGTLAQHMPLRPDHGKAPCTPPSLQRAASQQEVLACLTCYHTPVPSSDIKVTNGEGEMLEKSWRNRIVNAKQLWTGEKADMCWGRCRGCELRQADTGAEDGRSDTTSGSPVCQLPVPNRGTFCILRNAAVLFLHGFSCKNKIIKPLLILWKHFSLEKLSSIHTQKCLLHRGNCWVTKCQHLGPS